DLFIDNDELIGARNDVKIKTLTILYPLSLKHIFELIQLNQEIDKIKLMNENKMINNETLLKRHQELQDKKILCTKNFATELVKNYDSIVSANKLFRTKAKAFLYQLIEHD